MVFHVYKYMHYALPWMYVYHYVLVYLFRYISILHMYVYVCMYLFMYVFMYLSLYRVGPTVTTCRGKCFFSIVTSFSTFGEDELSIFKGEKMDRAHFWGVKWWVEPGCLGGGEIESTGYLYAWIFLVAFYIVIWCIYVILSCEEFDILFYFFI